MKCRTTLLLVACSFIGLGAGAPEARSPRLNPSRIASTLTWEGPQFLQADNRGNVFLLRGETAALDVFPLSRGDLGKPSRLQVADLAGGTVTDAAMSRDGSRWVLASANQILYFEDGRPQRTPKVGWFVCSVGVLHGTPVAGVLPMSLGRDASARRPDAPPLVLQFAGRGWAPLVEGAFPRRAPDRDPVSGMFADHTVEIATDRHGKIWLAYPYTGRVLRFTVGGRPDLEILLGKGTARHREGEAHLRQSFEKSLRKRGVSTSASAFGVFTAELAIHGMTVGQRGELYLLLSEWLTGDGPMLARYDPVTSLVETAPVRLDGDGTFSLAAGSDGLYLAASTGESGRWWLPSETVDGASWSEWPQAKVRTGTITRATLSQ